MTFGIEVSQVSEPRHPDQVKLLVAHVVLDPVMAEGSCAIVTLWQPIRSISCFKCLKDHIECLW